MLELDSHDLRRSPIEERKRVLVRRQRDGISFNQHFTCDGAIIYKHACALGCEGIVSKRLDTAPAGRTAG
jgi:bifunctional non-homologous end joining protein LigD